MDNDMFNELLSSVEQMDDIVKGKAKASRCVEFLDLEVRQIRERTGLSQTHFATMIGVSKRTLENWEQGRRHPTGPAKALLRIVESDPQNALRALHG